MRAIWGPGFDAIYQVHVIAEEIGSDLQQLYGADDDYHVGALLGLHARACLVLAEVHALMSQGFPLGAWARARSLHETAVLACVIAEYGREPGTEDLGERFLRHGVVEEARDVELAAVGGADIDQDYQDWLNDERARLKDRYGPKFAKDYGWARPLFPDLSPKAGVTFSSLEQLADCGLGRFDYRIGSHHVHSSARTLALNEFERGGKIGRLTGPTNIEFIEPAQVALNAMCISTQSIIIGVPPILEPVDAAGLAAMVAICDTAIELLEEAQDLVDSREAKVQKRKRRS
jgi:hypothetical protein